MVRVSRVFPAPAGINRAGVSVFAGRTRVPRASGDKPRIAAEKSEFNKVFPAPAGINRYAGIIGAKQASVPRASGDKPVLQKELIGTNECSPRQRG